MFPLSASPEDAALESIDAAVPGAANRPRAASPHPLNLLGKEVSVVAAAADDDVLAGKLSWQLPGQD